LDEHISSREASVQAFKSGDRVSLLQFHDVIFPSSAKDGLVTLLGFDLKMKGMSRVKEITRHALEGKDDQIRKLADRIENLLITCSFLPLSPTSQFCRPAPGFDHPFL